MEITVGQIAISKAGHDKGETFVIVSLDSKYVYICDGKHRKLENPKKKKIIHLSLTNTVLEKEAIKTNRQIIKALAIFKKQELTET